MDPITQSIIVQLAPYALGAVGMGIHGLFTWLSHKSHNATVQALSAQGDKTAQAVAQATGAAVIQAIQSGATGKQIGTAAAVAARTTAVQGALPAAAAVAQTLPLPADDHGG